MRLRSFLGTALLAASVLSPACVINPFEAEGEDHGSARLDPLPAPVAVVDNPTGEVALGLDSPRDGIIFVPSSYDPSVPMPMVVLLHGAGGSAAQILATHEELADSIGLIVLAVDSRAFTWDAIIARFDYDIDFINEAIASTLGRYNVDRSRLGVAGFSDGASYAMTLGLANGDIFRKVIVHSPGIRYRVRLVGQPAFYVAHGTEDEILPFLATKKSFVPFLEATGAEVTFRAWPGPHAMSVTLVRESLGWLAGP
jgi:phospholipase/carboxylesterase